MGAPRKYEDERACRLCDKLFPLTIEYFPKSYKQYTDGTQKLRYYCYDCWKIKKPKTTKRARHRARCKKYGITTEEFLAIWKQNSKCFYCGAQLNPLNFHIDHDHETDKFRGFACFSCNLIEGHLKKYDADRLESFIRRIECLRQP